MSNLEKIKKLRESTGAGFKDCGAAIEEANGDLNKAAEILRIKGISKASKKMSRVAKEGVIAVSGDDNKKSLIEINCETDFVARTDEFQDFSRDIAMHIAATSPLGIKREDISEDLIEKEKEIYKEQALQSGKPENIVDKMTEGRLNKFYQENVLLEQSFVKDPDKVISDLLSNIISKLGENIEIKRFSRFQLGELAKPEDNS